MSITSFNGFDKGVIGKKMPSDTTLNNMRKSDLIELLHIAENNHNVLVTAYKIAVDNSKCNQCPLGRDKAKIRAEAIDEFVEYLINPSNYENYDFDDCLTDSGKANDFFKYVFAMAEQVKEQKNDTI